MKLKVLIPFFILFLGLSAAQAQQRTCELAVTLLSPSQGQTIPAYAQYTLTVRIVNNGPSDLLSGDTLWYNTPSMPSFSYALYVLTQPILANASADITLKTYANINTNTMDETASFAATVISNPDGNGAYKDPDFSNNRDAKTVTFKPCADGGGTAVNNVTAKDLNIDVFPNPATDVIHVSSAMVDLNKITVVDITGKTVLENKVNTPAGKSFELKIASLNAGMYFLKIETAKGMAISKFMKK